MNKISVVKNFQAQNAMDTLVKFSEESNNELIKVKSLNQACFLDSEIDTN